MLHQSSLQWQNYFTVWCAFSFTYGSQECIFETCNTQKMPGEFVAAVPLSLKVECVSLWLPFLKFLVFVVYIFLRLSLTIKYCTAVARLPILECVLCFENLRKPSRVIINKFILVCTYSNTENHHKEQYKCQHYDASLIAREKREGK